MLAYKGDEASGQKSWYLDSGATNHMYGHRSMFAEFDESVEGQISFRDSSKILIKKR